jgi:preprotein translocase subunit SecF
VFIATPLLVQLKEMEPGIKAGDARALRSHKRKQVDPFASVPAFTEDMPVYDEPADEPEPSGPAAATRAPAATGPAPRYTAGERPASRTVTPSASAKRAQPERKPRSQRGKK